MASLSVPSDRWQGLSMSVAGTDARTGNISGIRYARHETAVRRGFHLVGSPIVDLMVFVVF